MSTQQEIVRIELTPQQKDQLKAKTGRDAEAIELTIIELEERIAPSAPRLASNHNDTFLAD